MLLLLGAPFLAYGQSSLLLKTVQLDAEAVSLLNKEAERKNNWHQYHFQGSTYLIIQFNEIPTEAERSALSLQGIQLFDYLPDNAFLAKVESWSSFEQIRNGLKLPLLPSFKLSLSLTNQLYGINDRFLETKPVSMPDIESASFKSALTDAGFKIAEREGELIVQLQEKDLQALASHPAVMWIEPAPQAPNPEGTIGNAVMRNNWLTQGPGDGHDGSGVVIGIADDGNVVHADVKNRLLYPPSLNWGSHGDMTVGIAAGAGNINPRALGLSPGATIHLSMITGYLHISNAVQYYNSYNVSITSTSYGEGCGGYYNTNAQILDDQLVGMPYISHVFSAGNDGNDNCSVVYGQVNGTGNTKYGGITGGRKAGKNCITVGNATFGDILMSSSSRGPVEDGRIKPDICAIGQGNLTTDANNTYRLGSGTSAAAPAIAGILANLSQAYKAQNGNQNPNSALLKAYLLNGARDIGRIGPDFETGWGLVHGKNSMEMLQANQYFGANVSHNGQRNHYLQVPAGAKALKVMLYWHDKGASPLASKALVNDLDLRVIAPNGALHYPLTLSSYPAVDSITRPAMPGIDRLNNVEQVVIDLPATGTYNIQVLGHLVPEGPQDYFVVYQWQTESLELVYPDGGESLVPGEQESIVWDAIGNTGNFTIQYSSNGGFSWQTLATGVAPNVREFNWIVPNTASGECMVRVIRSGQVASSFGTFNILEVPIFHITSASSQSAIMTWLPVDGANVYDVYELGNEYMQLIGTTYNNEFAIPTNLGQSNWYSVRARNTDGTVGRRAYAKHYEHYDCQSQLTLLLTMDGAPYQVSWAITSSSGQIMTSGNSYGSNAAFQQLEIPICLPEGCYTFSIQDSGNNGLCCQYGQGGYQLLAENGTMLASGTSFGSAASNNFCLEQTDEPLHVSMHNSPQTNCYGSNDGWALALPSGGNGTYFYQWSNGAQTQQINNLLGGLYTVTVSDGSSSIISQVYISEPAPISVNIYTEDSPCGEAADGEASATVAGGTPPYEYQWSNGSTTNYISQVESGYYQLTVTDVNGCSSIATTYVQSSSSIDVFLYSTSPSCHNSNDGIIYSYVTGGQGVLSYEWSDASSSIHHYNSSSGIYSVTVTDELGCSGSANILLEAPSAIAVIANIGQDEQSIDLLVSGGTPPYQYQWQDGVQTRDRENLEGGNYSVTVTDANGCTNGTSAQIIAPNNNTLCESSSLNATYNWIERVSLGSMQAISGNNQGYADFSNTGTLQPELIAGHTYPIVLEPEFLYNPFNVYWRVYIDLNEDGDFDDENELLFEPPASLGTIEGEIVIPSTGSFGTKQLRVSMAFGNPPLPCTDILYGEVEDYRIILTDDTQYCTSGGQSTSQEWIEGIQINSEMYTTGNNGGYADFSNILFQAEQGQQVFFNLIPGYASTSYPENWSIWADYNGNGVFEGGTELVFYKLNHHGNLSGSFTIPEYMQTGQIRIRVVMRWDESINACDTYAWGETEDYSLLILESSDLNDGNIEGRSNTPVSDIASGILSLGPNPCSDFLQVQYQLEQSSAIRIHIYDMLGKEWLSDSFHKKSGGHLWSTAVDQLPTGTYLLMMKGDHFEWEKRFVVQR